jgi:ATP-dependent 26S proteasome regulatory subunit
MKSERNPLSDNMFYKVTKLPSNAFAHHNAVFLSDKALTTDQHQKSYLIKLPNKKTNSVVYYPVIFDKSIPMKTLAMSSTLRDDLYYNLDEEVEFTLQERKNEEEQTVSIMYAEVQAMQPSSQKHHKKINETKLIASFNQAVENYPLSSEQVLFVPYNDDEYHGILQIKVLSNIIIDQLIYQADEKSIVIFTSASPQLFSIPINETPLPKKLSLDFTSKGVGGHKEQLKQIIQESFLPRALPPEYLEAYGEKHKNAGILLYGPPGTGKTLIARSIAECFTKDKVKVVNGPELKNKYVGQSHKKIYAIFLKKQKKNGNKKELTAIYMFSSSMKLTH